MQIFPFDTFSKYYFVCWQDNGGELERPADSDYPENFPVFSGTSRKTISRAHALCKEKGIGKGRQSLESHDNASKL